MLLAEIHLRRNEREAAASELQDLLNRHPDLPNASKINEEVGASESRNQPLTPTSIDRGFRVGVNSENALTNRLCRQPPRRYRAERQQCRAATDSLNQ
jgi:hypothetical protein